MVPRAKPQTRIWVDMLHFEGKFKKKNWESWECETRKEEKWMKGMFLSWLPMRRMGAQSCWTWRAVLKMLQKYSTKREGGAFVHQFFSLTYPPQLLSLTKGALTSNSWLPMLKLSSFHNFGESCEEEKQSLWFAGDGSVGHVWGTVRHSCAEILASKEEMEPKAPQVACYHRANLFAQIHLHHLSFYDKSSRRVGSFVERMGWAHWALSGFSCQRKQNLIMKLNIF